jgi:membrane protease YdiL (CAAX protease family)
MPAGQGIGARATWSVRDIVLGIVLAVLAVFILQLMFVAPAFLAGYDEDDSLTQGLAIVSNLVWNGALVWLVYMFAKRRGGSWASLGWRRPWEGESWSGWRLAGLVVGGYVSMWGVVALYNLLISALGVDFLQPDQQIQDEIFDETWLIVLMGLAVVIGAPLSEELFFRGFLYAGLRRRIWALPPALLTGTVFSMAHLQFGLIIPFTLIGAVLSIVYERTGSIWGNIALHFVFNLLSFMALVFVPEARN